jgi:hypothetical protein
VGRLMNADIDQVIQDGAILSGVEIAAQEK